MNDLPWKKTVLLLAFLSLSLIVKHVFAFFPLWLFFKTDSLPKKLAVLFVPFFLFGLSFLPFWDQGHTGIIENVFMYKSYDNAPFFQLLVPMIMHRFLTGREFFLIAMITAGYCYRKLPFLESIAMYGALLVLFSSAVASQYFAITVLFVALHMNIYTLGFTFFCGLFPTISKITACHDLGIIMKLEKHAYEVSTILLFAAWVMSAGFIGNFVAGKLGLHRTRRRRFRMVSWFLPGHLEDPPHDIPGAG